MRKRRFTLVEIMIVVAIIGLLAAIAIPNLVRARNKSKANACIQNLRAIDSAKEQYAMNAMNVGEGAVIADADITPYIKGEAMPACPSGGTYTPQPLGTDPTCSIANTGTYDHVLP